MKTVYGPVPSWRLGKSLGIDPICKRKACSFDCSYCQLGKTTELTAERRTFVEAGIVEKDLEEALERCSPDVVTFSGTGEPTLAENLGELISVAKKQTQVPVAVLTNSSLIDREEVRDELALADIVVAKLDAPNEQLFRLINKPHHSLSYQKIADGLKEFRKEFSGKLALQLMFIDLNREHSSSLAALAKELHADEVQLDTPLRHSPVKPLSPENMKEIKKDFYGMNTIMVYESRKPDVKPLKYQETKWRRPE